MAQNIVFKAYYVRQGDIGTQLDQAHEQMNICFYLLIRVGCVDELDVVLLTMFTNSPMFMSG
ncbi:unnamed protein product [Timema podura]|uniref:Uncharacterized protein n=1 Tax=Timema podura TaxID=61482 RepID=A0ABN7NWZ2_TIMPD|nr:unnamed protein product [Timema podura]